MPALLFIKSVLLYIPLKYILRVLVVTQEFCSCIVYNLFHVAFKGSFHLDLVSLPLYALIDHAHHIDMSKLKVLLRFYPQLLSLSSRVIAWCNLRHNFLSKYVLY